MMSKLQYREDDQLKVIQEKWGGGASQIEIEPIKVVTAKMQSGPSHDCMNYFNKL